MFTKHVQQQPNFILLQWHQKAQLTKNNQIWGDFDTYSGLNISIQLQARHTMFSGMFSEEARWLKSGVLKCLVERRRNYSGKRWKIYQSHLTLWYQVYVT